MPLMLWDFFLKKADYDNKGTRTEGKIYSIAGLATAATVNDTENKTPNVNDLVKKQVVIQKCQTLRKMFCYF